MHGRPRCLGARAASPPLALLLVCLAGCASAPAPVASTPAAGAVRVRLAFREQAVPHAVVTALRNPGVALREERVQVPAGADGRAEFRLAAGSWYLFAAAAAPGLFGWHGANPVQVRPGEILDVTIPAAPSAPPGTVVAAAPGEESVAGAVVLEDRPLAGVGVAFYLDGTTSFRGPGYLEALTDGQGAFATPVSPGRYWLVARRRSGQQPFGPLEAGDVFGFYPGNPVEVRAGERHSVRIPAVRVLKKSGWSGPSPARLRVSGTIRDGAGRPLAGFRAFLHARPAMLGKPEFVSEPSGPDGTYVIWVDREGSFFLGARAEIGRAREEREAIGLYGGSPDHGLAVRLGAGDLPGRDIVVGGGGAP